MTGDNLKYILAILNSKLFEYALLKIYLEGDTFKSKNAIIQNFPVPPINEKTGKLIEIVDNIISKKQENSTIDTSTLESEIDRLVYQLYGLTDEEIKIVEGKEGFIIIWNHPELYYYGKAHCETITEKNYTYFKENFPFPSLSIAANQKSSLEGVCPDLVFNGTSDTMLLEKSTPFKYGLALSKLNALLLMASRSVHPWKSTVNPLLKQL